MARPFRFVALASAVLMMLVLRGPAGARQCAGDCDADLVVGVDELVLCIGMALGDSAAGCDSCDPDRSGVVTVDELISAVGSALGIVLQGVCRVPCQGAECELPEATTNGLVPCAEGTEVEVARCNDRTVCLREKSGRAVVGTGLVESGGGFSVRIDACQSLASLFVVEAVVDEQSAASYRTLFGSAAGTALSAFGNLSFVDELLLDPSTEAAVQLLDTLGLENFTDEGAVGVLDAVTSANQNTQYANQSPATAATDAVGVASEDPGVEDAVMRGRVPTPTPVPPTATPPKHAAEFEIGSAIVAPNNLATIEVTLNVAPDADVVGTLNDVGFEPGARIAEATMPMGVLATDVTATDTAIPLDDARDLAPFGSVQVDDEVMLYGEIRGNVLIAGGCAGGDSGTACADDDECSGGGVCQPSGRGQAGTTASAHTAGAMISAHRMPDCHMSTELEAIGKNAVFSFLPPGCDPAVDCDTVRAIVIAHDNLNPFPNGETTLYTCRAQAGPLEGTFPLTCDEVQASGPPDGPGLLGATCLEGEVVVQLGVPTETPTPTRGAATPTATRTPTLPRVSSVSIDVESVSGRRGETVQLDVTLQVVDAEVAATDNVLTVPGAARILRCEIPSTFGGFSQVVYEPEDCEEDPSVGCSSIRALIISDDLDPIQNGALLYSCAVSLSVAAEPGSYPIVCSEQLAAHPSGRPFNGTGRCEQSLSVPCDDDGDCASVGGACRILPPTDCANASLTVMAGTPLTPTPTEGLPTSTPTPTGTSDDRLEIHVGSTALLPDEVGTFDVTLRVGAGVEAAGVQHEIFFAEGITLSTRMTPATVLTADIDFDDVAIPVEDADSLPDFGFAQIDEEIIAYVRFDGDILAVGSCSVGGACVADADCGEVGSCEPVGRGQNGTLPAAHLAGATVEFPSDIPDCMMSPELDVLDKSAVFSIVSDDCTPGIDCRQIRAFVFGFSNVDPFPEGDTPLYSCNVRAGAEEGTFPLHCLDPRASDPAGGMIGVTCLDGAAFVHTAICGNGMVEEPEECDDGSICLPSFQDCTETGECPDGERCEPVGGDGCARNCTIETARASSLDSEESGFVIQLGVEGVGVVDASLGGQQIVRAGMARTDETFGHEHVLLARAGDVPIAIRAGDTSIDPASLGILVCACLEPVEQPLFGPALSAVGTIGCGDAGSTDVSFLAEQDHNTTPGDTNNSGPDSGLADDPSCETLVELGQGRHSSACFEGLGTECSGPVAIHAVCNSPRVVTFSGGPAPRGSTVLHTKLRLSFLQDAGACDTTLAGATPCPHEDYGADCVPCTSDDAGLRTLIDTALTTGTASAVIYDNNNRGGELNLHVAGPGEPADCDAMRDDSGASLQGVLVGAFPNLDMDLIGDTTISMTLGLK